MEKTQSEKSKLHGYVRVSTSEQSLGLGEQLHRLVQWGIPEQQIVTDVASGKKNRKQLDELVSKLGAGDTLAVARLDRLGRSMCGIAALVAEIEERGASLVSVMDGLQSNGPAGNLLIHILGAAAQYEREILSERTSVALQEAKRRGVRLGRPPRLGPIEMKTIIGELEDGAKVAQLARKYHCDASTLWKRLREQGWRRGEK